MLRLAEERCRTVAGLLPPETVIFLRDTGVSETVVFRAIEHTWTLDMGPLLDGGACRVGHVDGGWYAMAVRRVTGHFGYVFSEPGQPKWVFCNTTVARFLACFAASEQVCEMEQAKRIAREDRGEFSERSIREIDPEVFGDENNIWAVLVEGLRAGVV